ncbi:MAG: hybrid sensor histidine kinase/response regulator [Bacteroidetes bacterium]|nr:MAG: hybrid sensor histidine kinase/response regulator [Bacteroidota bacterium]
MQKTAFVLCYLLICFGLPAFAQQAQMSFRHFNVEAGLSEGTVNCFLQDRLGFIWVGTIYGLNRFDGYEFKVFKHDPQNPRSISDNNIHALCEDSLGRIWIGTSKGLNRYDPATDTFVKYTEQEGDERGLTSRTVNSLLIDSRHRLWVGTAWGLNLYQPETDDFFQIKPDENKPNWLSHNWINKIYEDRQGQIWVGTGRGLNRLLMEEDGSITFESFLPQAGNPRSISHADISDICEDQQGNLWVSTQGGGVNSMHRQSGQFIHFRYELKNPYSLSHERVNSLYVDSRGQLWIATDGGGLNLYQPQSGQFIRLLHNPETPSSLSNNDVRAVFEDVQGNLWVGNTNGGGINLWFNSGKEFRHIKASPKDSYGLSFNHVTTFWERADGNLWVGTDGGGLNFYHRPTGRFVAFRHQVNNPNSLGGDKVLTVVEDRQGQVWVGGWGAGLTRFVPRFGADGLPVGGSFTTFMADGKAGSLSSPNVTCVLEDHLGNIWAGHGYGLDRLDARSGTFTNFRKQGHNPHSLADNGVWALYEDRKGNMWVGTRDGGLNLFHHDSQQFTRYLHQPGDTSSLSHNYVWSILEDSRGRLWVGTQGGGLNLLDPETGTFTHIREKDGLASDVIASLEEDGQGQLWIGTSNGISRYNPETGEIRNYTAGEGLQGQKFARMSSLRARSGELFFGGTNGFNVFWPEQIRDNAYIPPVRITDFQLFNQSVLPGSKDAPFEQTIIFNPPIRLKYWQSVFSFEFASLNYINPEENEYQFRLEGFDRNWRKAGHERSTTYTNLSPGDYVFRVKGSNNDGIWNEEGASVQLSILPPPWLSWWAYGLYVLAAALLLLLARRQIIQRERLKSSLHIKALEAAKLQEIDQAKSRFFANISHELRTPLTVILGMTDDILDHIPGISWEQLRHKLQLVRRNGASLLQLVNQILDLAKLESRAIRLHWVKGDIVAYIHYLVESFHSYAESKNIHFEFIPELEQLEMDYDPERLKDILSNLLSNAIKFTPAGGGVKVRVALEAAEAGQQQPPQLKIEVIDTGKGIAATELPYIFDRFYQAEDGSTRSGEGTGIGLALARELARLMGGDIQAESEVGRGSVFRVFLPVTRQATEVAPAWEAQQTPLQPAFEAPAEGVEPLSSPETGERPLLLIAEDNADVVTYLKSCLQDTYRLAIASNGAEGIEMAIELIPDIIITDVMMPVKDGYQLCHTLKEDERTSHIPIIMLTAKAGMDDKLTGLRRGADAYLTKPFHKEELQVRLHQLVALRRKLLARYRQLEVPQGTGEAHPEDAFLLKVRRIVEEQLDNSEFDVPMLCKEVGMSRSQLHRKLKALTDRSATQFIRGIRLQKARHLLLHTSMSIAEIAYAVGFSDPNYFSRSFVKEYEHTPSELRDARG